MSNRRDYHFRQTVTETELDTGFDELEAAERAIVQDLLGYGVASGMGVTQATPAPNLSVNVAAGLTYDQLGQRIYLPTTQPLDLSIDSNGVSTAVGSGGNAKVVSIFAQFTRALSDPRTDGNSVTVYFARAESFALIVRQGAEAVDGSEAPPALEADKILLADVKRTFGQTQITTAQINSYATNRRQDAFVGVGNFSEFRVGLVKDAVEALRQSINEPIITPVAISGNVSEYNPTGWAASRILRQDCSAAASLRSLAAKKAGTRIRIFNISTNTANTLTLNHEDTSGTTAGLRFVCPNLANHVIRAGGAASCWYDGTSSRWRVEAA